MTERAHENLDQFQWSFLHPKYWLLWFWFAILWLIGRLPLSAIRALGTGTGRLVFKIAKSRRKTTLKNLELCFPEKTPEEREVIAKESFASAGMALYESGLIWWGRKKRVMALHSVSGLEHLKQREGEPTILLAMHNSCLEAAYGPLAQHHAMKILFRVHNNPCWEYVSQKGRNRYNLKLVSNKRVSRFLEHIRQGETGVIAADHDLGPKNSIFVPFFGIPTATVPTPSDFAKATDAKVLFSCGYRTKTGYQVDITPVFENFPSDDTVADVTRFSAIVEEHVRLHPGEYIWMHRRFKTRPPGDAKLY